jgi:Zn-dependent membrane protease YugP
MLFDPMYFVYAVPGIVLVLWAQWKVKSTFARYAQIGTARGISGDDAARTLMGRSGIRVGVERIPGQLTDHYDPRTKVIRLSESSLDASIAAVAVVAHELGHAEQDARNYAPLQLRSGIVPLVQTGTALAPWLFLGGYLLRAPGLQLVGLIGFSLMALFSLVTLPVEFDASRRALKNLESSGILAPGELVGAKHVLDAAAFTYVAGAAQSILTLMYYISLFVGGRRRD